MQASSKLLAVKYFIGASFAMMSYIRDPKQTGVRHKGWNFRKLIK